MSATTATERQVNWEAVIDDLAWMYGEPVLGSAHIRTPLSANALAFQINRPRMTVQAWRDGGQPKHADGEYLIRLWCGLSGKDRAFVPMCKPMLSAARVK